jgi:hypothetical protein
MRIKIPAIQHRSRKAEDIQQLLLQHEGVEHVRTTTLTGSVVVHYDPDLITPDEIVNILRYENFVDETRLAPYDAHLFTSTHRAGRALGRAAVSWAVGRALEGSGLGFLAVLI